MRLVVLPGVFRPIADSRLLAGCVAAELEPGDAVADLCTGSGLLAITAACNGAGAVTAVDISRRSVLNVRLNARLNHARIRVVRGDLFAPLTGERFDLIVSNPPYVPTDTAPVPSAGPSRAWMAGRDGRAFLDRLCARASAHLRPGGRLLLVHSSVCHPDRSIDQLTRTGLSTAVVARDRGPLGPLLSADAERLQRVGLLAPGQTDEELVVIRGQRASVAQTDALSSSGRTCSP
jgi:release factor glutamine methyltransferase